MTVDSETVVSLGTVDQLRAAHAWAVNRFGLYLRSSRFWLILGGSVTLTSVAGPFGTLEQMGWGARLVYWSATVVPSTLFMLYLSMWMREFARNTGRPWIVAALTAGVIGTAPILALALSVNALMLDPANADPLLKVTEFVSAAVIITTVLLNAVMPAVQPLRGLRRTPAVSDEASAPVNAGSGPSPFFDRLPPELGREMISLRAANHHLHATTARGQARVLMRLADAEAELVHFAGMRVHRSWWVNLAHVVSTDIRAGGLELTLTDGTVVPVSRSQRVAVAQMLEQKAAQ